METNTIPAKDPLFVQFGPFEDIRKIIESKLFYPLFVTGLSGNGKTFMIEQSCAHANRELIRVNITIETDEDDLLGGFRLINDSTKWFDGPVIRAMKSGAVLLLDEVDLASTKIMCLQPVLEGKGIFLKKINQYIQPAKGFNIVATANTKGQGSESGKFIGTNIMNEAFLERFPVTFEHNYPDSRVEEKILNLVLEHEGIKDPAFVRALLDWAAQSRQNFYADVSSEIITTRRLVHIVKAFSILKDKRKAIELCISRFDSHNKQAFMELYEKFDESILDESVLRAKQLQQEELEALKKKEEKRTNSLKDIFEQATSS
jgi:MoxR-like ATPase